MTTDKQIEIANTILATGLVSQVFHSCEMLRDETNNVLYPAYPKGNEYTYAGIDDAKGLFAYIRTNGDQVGVPLKITSCSRSYDMDAPMRVVFFSDNEGRNHEELVRKLSSFTFMNGITLQRVITDKWRLIREESPIFRSRFDGKTFYVAFDVLVAFILLPSDCQTDLCVTHPNPLKKCPAAVPMSSSSATS